MLAGIDLLEDKQAAQRLVEAAEKAKVELASVSEVNQPSSLDKLLSSQAAYQHTGVLSHIDSDSMQTSGKTYNNILVQADDAGGADRARQLQGASIVR